MVKNLLNLFFPRVCAACNAYLGDKEQVICTSCRHQLPVTDFHDDPENSVMKRLYGRVKLQNATALLHFSKKGLVQELMHNLKYRGQEEIGSMLGSWLGEELKLIDRYKTIDLVVPVPLHPSKKRKRGYNQVDKFAKKLAKALNSDFLPEALIREKASATQVFKNRLGRTSNMESKFSKGHLDLSTYSHVLLVDDIITTGSTIECCASILNHQPNLKISVATMAITD